VLLVSKEYTQKRNNLKAATVEEAKIGFSPGESTEEKNSN